MKMNNPDNEAIAIWLGWKRWDLQSPYRCYKNIDGDAENLPDWRGDPWRWVEVMDAIPLDVKFLRHVSGFPYRVTIYGEHAFRGIGDSKRQAFWSAFDAAWPELKRAE